jgi:hypothetical protein
MHEPSLDTPKPPYVGSRSLLVEKLHTLAMDGVGIFSKSDIVGPAGLGPCLGTIIYDIRIESALVGHFDKRL